MSTPWARFAVLTGPLVSLIVFALALGAPNLLYRNDLELAAKIEGDVRGRLDGSSGVAPATRVREPSDPFDMALMQMPEATPVDALPLYEEAERAAFARAKWAGNEPPPSASGLPAAVDVDALYEAGVVSLRWQPGRGLGAIQDSLPTNHELAWRIYRAEGGGDPVAVATVPLDVLRWRDAAVPLAATELSYTVWCTQQLVDPGGLADPVLVTAEPSEMVTIRVPEHFQLVLVGGSANEAIIRVDIGPESQSVSSVELVLHPGDGLRIDDRSTGLVLTDLAVTDAERLTTLEHLDLKSDGTVVLDPESQQPRMTETQVLTPVTQLIATLTDSQGGIRTLELDLP